MPWPATNLLSFLTHHSSSFIIRFFRCKWCTGSFCQDHFKVDKHSCPQLEQAQAADKKAAVCPKCNEVVMVLPGEDVDAKGSTASFSYNEYIYLLYDNIIFDALELLKKGSFCLSAEWSRRARHFLLLSSFRFLWFVRRLIRFLFSDCSY